MPLVVLLDASPHTSGQIPLSWWCAAELAQWPSAAMTTDVFQFTLSHHLHRMSKEYEQESSNVECTSTTADMIVDASNKDSGIYLFLPFPQTIKAANKYFTTEIHLLCGFYIDREDVCESSNHIDNKQKTTLQEQEQQKATCTESINSNSSNYIGNVFIEKWNAIMNKSNVYNIKTNVQSQELNVECMLHNIINKNGDDGVGIVYLTSSAPHLQVQSAIWELFIRSLVALKAAMFFNLETENDMNNNKTMNNVSRWRDVCVNEEIELIVHECEEVHRCPEEYQCLADDSCQDKTNCNCALHSSSSKQIKWESVNANVGKLGILSSPVTGTNRLMQLLAQTPWPEEQGKQASTSNYKYESIHNNSTVDIQKNKESEEDNLSSRQNVFLVVGDSACAAINAFVSHERVASGHTNKWAERFYTVKSKSANFTQKYQNKSCNRINNNIVEELVLVNRYYVATVRACCMHYYWFHPSMATMRHKELLSWTHTDGFALHAYVFATVDMYKELLQAVPLTSSMADMKSSSGWTPSLQYIVSELQSYNIDPIIVIDDNKYESNDCVATSNNNDTNYKECNSDYNKCVSKLNVEVILLNKSKNTTVTTQLQEWKEYERETHGYDRLLETLHCVDWKYKLRRVSSYAIPRSLFTSKEEQTRYNSNKVNTKSVEKGVPFINNNNVNLCLLSVFGKTAESEEEILYRIFSECFDIDFDSVIPQQGQCYNYKSIVTTVPSLLLECMDEHTPEVSMAELPSSQPQLSYEISNKYMTAEVELNVLGGICTRQGINFENASCVKVELYDVLLVCCTFEALARAAAAAYSTTSINENNNQDVMSVLLCHAIQSLQQIAVEEFDEMVNTYSDKEKELEKEQSQTREQDASHLMALFVVDVPADK